ncbi:MAG: hypothetical protein Q7J67_05235 [bacterium]|nr:hypothetical protein [bacterium]
MDKLTIKHFLDELPIEILESVYSIDISTNFKLFKAQMDYDQDIYERYKDNIYRPVDDDDYCADFIDFKIGPWRVVMETENRVGDNSVRAKANCP